MALRDQATRRRPATAKASSAKEVHEQSNPFFVNTTLFDLHALCPRAPQTFSKTNPTRSPQVKGSRATGKFGASERKDSDENGGDDEAEESFSPDSLIKQNYELRHRLEEEAASYKRRLDTYRQAQQHQAALVSRLQAKVTFTIILFSVIASFFSRSFTDNFFLKCLSSRTRGEARLSLDQDIISASNFFFVIWPILSSRRCYFLRGSSKIIRVFSTDKILGVRRYYSTSRDARSSRVRCPSRCRPTRID